MGVMDGVVSFGSGLLVGLVAFDGFGIKVV